jgi:23S rRNA G2069 N7-methylase RlmK/C1962 C5-methylase RlmI
VKLYLHRLPKPVRAYTNGKRYGVRFIDGRYAGLFATRREARRFMRELS